MPIPDKDFFDRTAAVVRSVEGMPPRGRSHRGTRRYFSDQFYPFELTANLSSGSSANANLTEWDIDSSAFVTTGDTITVFDDFGVATLGGKTGDQGLFIYVEDDRRVVTQLSTIARWIEFTVDSALDAGDATKTCTVVQFHDGSDPDPTSSGISVHFDLAFDADEDAPGIAFLGSDGNYHCLNINCIGA